MSPCQQTQSGKEEHNEKIDFFSNESAFFQLNLDKPKTTVLILYVSINIEPVSNATSSITNQAVPFQGDAFLMICPWWYFSS